MTRSEAQGLLQKKIRVIRVKNQKNTQKLQKTNKNRKNLPALRSPLWAKEGVICDCFLNFKQSMRSLLPALRSDAKKGAPR